MTFGASFSVATQQQLLPPPGHKSFPATPRNHLQGTLSYTSAWHLQPASTPTVMLASKSVDLHQLLPQPNTIRALALSAGDTLAEASDFEQPAQGYKQEHHSQVAQPPASTPTRCTASHPGRSSFYSLQSTTRSTPLLSSTTARSATIPLVAGGGYSTCFDTMLLDFVDFSSLVRKLRGEARDFWKNLISRFIPPCLSIYKLHLHFNPSHFPICN